MNVFGGGESYAYACGMVAGLYGRLLRPGDMEAITQAGSVEEALSYLSGTEYGNNLRQLKPGFSLQDIEEAIASHFRSSYVEVAAAIPEGDKGIFDSIMLGGWDLNNLKTVVRCVRASAAKEDAMRMLFPLGRLGKPVLGELLKSGEMAEMKGKAPSPYTELFEKAFEKKDPLEFEEELDRSYLKGLLEEAGGDIGEYVRLLVDALNLRTIVRCAEYNIDPSKHIINEGHYITANKLAQLSRQDKAGIIKTLEDTPYGKAVKETLSDAAGVRFESLDLRLRGVLNRETEYKAVHRPLSVNTVIAYVKKKENEANNVRAVLAGKWFGLSPTEIGGILR
ncbi:MAG: V-type ATPase subunit [Candidatus Altiarchaeota archaeon]